MIKAGFIVLSIIMAALAYTTIATAAKKTINDATKLHQFRTRTLLLLLGWLTFVCISSLAGVYSSLAFPPRVPLLLVMPCFVFMGWFFRSGRFAGVINAVPLAWVTYTQSFRIVVELLLLGLYLQGLIPRVCTFEGFNYEIITGITALAVGYLGVTKRILPRGFVLAWNFFGLGTLAIVVFIFLSHVYFPGIYVNPDPLPIENFGAFPNTLLAGFLMPLAVFMHVFSIVKLRQAPEAR